MWKALVTMCRANDEVCVQICTQLLFGGTLRPNVVSGAAFTVDGDITERIRGNTTDNLYRPGAYAELELTPVPSLLLIPALRVDYARDTNQVWAVQPRFSFRWEFLRDWFLKGGVGVFNQPPQPQQSSGAVNSFNPATTVGNPFLGTQRSVHYGLGMEHNFSQYLSLSVEGFYKSRNGFDQAVSRGLAYAPYADLIWCETGTPDLKFARDFAEAIHKQFPGKMLSYNCSPSFNWKKNLDESTIAKFQRELGAMGYKFQFITLAGFHSLNYGMFDLAYGYARNNMSAFVELQEKEFAAAERGFTAVKHQREVGTGYFDAVTTTIEKEASTAALKGSTEDEQFFDKKHA